MQVGSRVRVIPHPYLPPTLTPGDEYTVEAYAPEAGQVCLKEFGRRKTFPDHWFTEIDNSDE